jgi:pyroglutamyl-peptidase
MRCFALTSAFLCCLALTSLASAKEDPVVLLTGFKPWGTRTHNPSWEGVKLLEGEMIEGHLVRTTELAVDYREVDREVPKVLGSVPQPAAVIHFGVAGSPELRLERKAHNQAGWHRDDGGYAPVDNRVAEDGPMIYTSELPEQEILVGMKEAGHGIRTSDNAGSYLCEYTFYTGLYHREKLGQRSSAGFIHVPYFRTRKPPVNAETLAAGMRELVAIVLRKRKADAAVQASGGHGAPLDGPAQESGVPDPSDAGPEVAENDSAGPDSVPFDGEAAPQDTPTGQGTSDQGPPKSGIADVISAGDEKEETKAERRARKKRERQERRRRLRRRPGGPR